ncbi:MAG: type II toxin-antitoxin system RelE/ParE family toxin [Sedimenticola sp.]
MFEVRWSDPALDDLEGIRDYIAKDSPFYAKQFIEHIFGHVEKLTSFPKMGRMVPEAGDREDIRELIFQGYRIIYLSGSEQAEIITVIHGSMDLSEEQNQPWE